MERRGENRRGEERRGENIAFERHDLVLGFVLAGGRPFAILRRIYPLGDMTLLKMVLAE